MSEAVRERVWNVLAEWTADEPDCSVVMTWPDRSQLSGQSVRVLGAPACDLVAVDGVVLVRRDLARPEPGSTESETQKPVA
jgi:CRISPR-associated protein Cas2